MYNLRTLDPVVLRSLVNYCARELNHERYGTYIPFYLWERSNQREAERVLRAAEQFFKTGMEGQSGGDRTRRNG